MQPSATRFLTLARFRPALYGAAILAAVVALRAIPALAQGRLSMLQFLKAVLAGGVGGAAGGLVHGLFGERLLDIPRLGPYVWGVVCVGAYMGALAIVVPLAIGEPVITGRAGASLIAIVIVFGGLVMGSGYAGTKRRGGRREDLSDTRWGLVGAVVLVGGVLAVAMKLAGWW